MTDEKPLESEANQKYSWSTNAAKFIILAGGASAFKEMYSNPIKMTQYQFGEFMASYLMPGFMCFTTWKTMEYWSSLNISVVDAPVYIAEQLGILGDTNTTAIDVIEAQ